MKQAAAITVMVLTGSVYAQTPATPPAADVTSLQGRETVARLTEQLRVSIGDRDTGRRERTLAGLRALRDPEMAALFAQLSINPAPGLRVHGLLGLAELEPRRGLDLLGVSRIPDRRLQGRVIYEALAGGLINVDELPELSSWPWLDPRVRLDLAGVCLARSCPFDVDGVKQLLGDPDAFTAVAAALLLTHANVDGAAAQQVLRTRAQGLTSGPVSQAGDLATFVIEHNLRSGSETLAAIAASLKTGPEADAVAVARLVCAPESPGALAAARARLDVTVPAVQRRAFSLRFLDGVLRLDRRTPRTLTAEMLTDPDPLVKAMGAAAESFTGDQSSLGAAVGKLATTGEPDLVAWALRCASERHWQDATAIRSAVLAGIAARPSGAQVDPRMAAMGVLAAAELADDDPRALDRPLAEALSNRDATLVQIMLEGALRSTHRAAGALVRQGGFEARPAGPWPTEQAAATALLVAARHGEFTASPSERIERLLAIARGERGAGGLSGVLRAQAAWLALRASGEDRVALTRILNDLPAPTADTPPSRSAPSAAQPSPTSSRP